MFNSITTRQVSHSLSFNITVQMFRFHLKFIVEGGKKLPESGLVAFECDDYVTNVFLCIGVVYHCHLIILCSSPVIDDAVAAI